MPVPMYNPSHPGRVIRFFAGENGLDETEFARDLGVAQSDLSDLLNGRCGITPEMARALEGAGWSNAAFWLRVQKSYDEAQIRMREEPPPVWDDISEIPPEDLPHPAAYIRNFMDEDRLTPDDVAKTLGLSPSAALDLIDERARVTPKIARALERAGRGLAKHWLLSQRSHDEAQALARERERLHGGVDRSIETADRPLAPARRSA